MRQQLLMKEVADLREAMDTAKFKIEMGFMLLHAGRDDMAQDMLKEGLSLLDASKIERA